MNGVPFLYVNLIALCLFAFLLIAFLAAKKTPEIRAFIFMLIACIFWTGGSLLMRLGVFPGIRFWFNVSLVALFAMPLLIYLFVVTFARRKGYLGKLTLGVFTLVLEILTVCGLILDAPARTVLPDGGAVYSYTIGWPILVTGFFLLLYVLMMIRMFVQITREKGRRFPGIVNVVAGCSVMLLGNMLQLLPGNVFPYDTLAGIFFALLLMWALYKKRMFQMSLLISRSAVLVAGLALCIFVAANFVSPVENFLTGHYLFSGTAATTIIVVAFAIFLSALFVMIRKLVDALFTREEQQNRLLKNFSTEISQSLDTEAVMDKLIGIIRCEIPVRGVYVCRPENGAFVAQYGSEQLASKKFSIAVDSPCIRYLQKNESHFILSDFKADPLYRSVWQEEKELFRQLSLSCVYAMRDGNEIVGLLLLSEKERSGQYTYTELNFLDTVVSIASIAVKNAGLYEKMYREARVDSLTGVYNYRYFVEETERQFEACRSDCLALVYVDLDDFRLYNQLYGSLEGDNALRAVAQILSQCTAGSGTVYRYSGKVFAVLLPHCDGRRAEQLACEIRRQMDSYNSRAEFAGHKTLSVSCGICVSPYGASSAKELIEHADLAVYNAKNNGKNRINTFRGTECSDTHGASDRVLQLLERGVSQTAAYQANIATISALTAAIDAKDHYTYQHSKNVALYAALLATAAGLGEEQVSIIFEAGLLHDIGKISVPEAILSKTGPLSNQEYAVMKNHVNNAIEMIRHLPSMDYVIPAAVGHHERWDGHGYPRGLQGEEIPVSARCLAVADAYDAMTTDRPYRKGMTTDYAAEQIEKNIGTQFDPRLATIFLRLIRDGELEKAKADMK